MTDDVSKTISPTLPVDADSELAEPAGERLAGLTAEVERRDRELERQAWELAADRAYRPPVELRLAALFALLITIVLAVVACTLFALAIHSVGQGHVIAEWEWTWHGPHRRYMVGGPFGDLVLAAIVGHFASTANRARKRLLRRPREG